MPDEPHLFEYLTVEEHLRLIARLYTVDDFERRVARAARRARADRQGAVAAGRAVARHAAEGRHRLRPRPQRDDAAVRRAADRPRPARHSPDARDDRRRAPAPAPRSCCRRTCCTWSRRSARASSSWTAGRKVADGTFDELRARAELAAGGIEPRADLPARHRARHSQRRSRDRCWARACTSSCCSARNRVRVRLRRLREPRYLIGAIVGAAYLVLQRVRAHAVGAGVAQAGAGRLPAAMLDALRVRCARRRSASRCWRATAARAGSCRSTAGCWTSRRPRSSFSFRPRSRGAACSLHRMMRSQIGILFGSVISP